MKSDLLQWICCPACKGDLALEVAAGDALSVTEGTLSVPAVRPHLPDCSRRATVRRARRLRQDLLVRVEQVEPGAVRPGERPHRVGRDLHRKDRLHAGGPRRQAGARRRLRRRPVPRHRVAMGGTSHRDRLLIRGGSLARQSRPAPERGRHPGRRVQPAVSRRGVRRHLLDRRAAPHPRHARGLPPAAASPQERRPDRGVALLLHRPALQPRQRLLAARRPRLAERRHLRLLLDAVSAVLPPLQPALHVAPAVGTSAARAAGQHPSRLALARPRHLRLVLTDVSGQGLLTRAGRLVVP